MMSKLIIFLAIVAVAQIHAFTTPVSHSPPTFVHSKSETQRYNILDVFGSMISNFNKKVTASHILIKYEKGQDPNQVRNKLLDIKKQIANNPEKFAQAARQYSACPSAKNGGSLGEFGPGQMVKNFDKVRLCFVLSFVIYEVY